MRRTAPDTADDATSGPPLAQRPVTGPAAMMAAIEADDLAAMERCWVPELAAEKLPTEHKDTCLMYGCHLGSRKAMRWLVREGRGDVNLASADGWTPLLFSAKNGYLELMRYLVNKVGNANADQVTRLLSSLR
jgi:ankyrin repeat protein